MTDSKKDLNTPVYTNADLNLDLERAKRKSESKQPTDALSSVRPFRRMLHRMVRQFQPGQETKTPFVMEAISAGSCLGNRGKSSRPCTRASRKTASLTGLFKNKWF